MDTITQISKNPTVKHKETETDGVESAKIFEFKTNSGEIARIKVWFERFYYFRAEFINLFPSAKFDYFTETGDLHKGIQSKTLKDVVEANLFYFDYYNGENAEKLFGENICIVKNKPLGEKIACVDCIRKFIFDREKNPLHFIYSTLIGQTSLDSFSQIFIRLRDEKKSYKQVYLNEEIL